MKELVSLHDKHLTRPTLDDNVDEEHAIEIQTQDITQVKLNCSPKYTFQPVHEISNNVAF